MRYLPLVFAIVLSGCATKAPLAVKWPPTQQELRIKTLEEAVLRQQLELLKRQIEKDEIQRSYGGVRTVKINARAR